MTAEIIKIENKFYGNIRTCVLTLCYFHNFPHSFFACFKNYCYFCTRTPEKVLSIAVAYKDFSEGCWCDFIGKTNSVSAISVLSKNLGNSKDIYTT